MIEHDKQQHIMKQRAVLLVIALVGKQLSDQWWNTPNKAFDNKTPAGQWLLDHRSVYNYLMACNDYS